MLRPPPGSPSNSFAVKPNFYDYEGQRASFSWDELAKELDGLPGELVDRGLGNRLVGHLRPLLLICARSSNRRVPSPWRERVREWGSKHYFLQDVVSHSNHVRQD